MTKAQVKYKQKCLKHYFKFNKEYNETKESTKDTATVFKTPRPTNMDYLYT